MQPPTARTSARPAARSSAGGAGDQVDRRGAGARGAAAAGDGPGDLVGHLLRYLVAAAAGGRADHGGGAGGLGAEALHRGEGGLQDAGGQALPAGVRHRDDPGSRVGEQHRQAVGGQHQQPQPGGRGDESVDAVDRAAGVDDRDLAAVHLRHEDQVVGGQADGGGEPLAVGAHRGRVVADVVAQVERVVRRGADAARPGAERARRAGREAGRQQRQHAYFRKSGTSRSSSKTTVRRPAVGCGAGRAAGVGDGRGT